MPINDMEEENNFQQLNQDISRRRRFGFTQGLNTQPVYGSFPEANRPEPRTANSPTSGARANYDAPHPAQAFQQQGTGSMSQAWGGLGGNVQQGLAAPANSRALRRSGGDMTNNANIRNINVDFGSDNINSPTFKGDVAMGGSAVDKRTQTATQTIGDVGSVSGRQTASGGRGGDGGAGSTKPNAPGGGNGGRAGTNTQTTTGSTMKDVSVGNSINFGDTTTPSGGRGGQQVQNNPTTIASNNVTTVQKGKTNTATSSRDTSNTNNTTNNTTAPSSATPANPPATTPATKGRGPRTRGSGKPATSKATSPVAAAAPAQSAPTQPATSGKTASAPAATPAPAQPATTPTKKASGKKAATPKPAPTSTQPVAKKSGGGRKKDAPKADNSPKA